MDDDHQSRMPYNFRKIFESSIPIFQDEKHIYFKETCYHKAHAIQSILGAFNNRVKLLVYMNLKRLKNNLIC